MCLLRKVEHPLINRGFLLLIITKVVSLGKTLKIIDYSANVPSVVCLGHTFSQRVSGLPVHYSRW